LREIQAKVLAEAARELEAKASDLGKQLDQAKQAAARPLADAWAELRGAGADAAAVPPGGFLPKKMTPWHYWGREVILPALDAAEDAEGFRLRLTRIIRTCPCRYSWTERKLAA
jgi:hypothetical protein